MPGKQRTLWGSKSKAAIGDDAGEENMTDAANAEENRTETASIPRGPSPLRRWMKKPVVCAPVVLSDDPLTTPTARKKKGGPLGTNGTSAGAISPAEEKVAAVDAACVRLNSIRAEYAKTKPKDGGGKLMTAPEETPTTEESCCPGRREADEKPKVVIKRQKDDVAEAAAHARKPSKRKKSDTAQDTPATEESLCPGRGDADERSKVVIENEQEQEEVAEAAAPLRKTVEKKKANTAQEFEYPDPAELAAESGLDEAILAILPPDAPKGHESYKKSKWVGSQGIAVFQYPDGTNGGKVNFQTTSRACGSRYAAERIARACYMRFEGKETKDLVLTFRATCYARLPVPIAKKEKVKAESDDDVIVMGTAAPERRKKRKRRYYDEDSEDEVLTMSEEFIGYMRNEDVALFNAMGQPDVTSPITQELLQTLVDGMDLEVDELFEHNIMLSSVALARDPPKKKKVMMRNGRMLIRLVRGKFRRPMPATATGTGAPDTSCSPEKESPANESEPCCGVESSVGTVEEVIKPAAAAVFAEFDSDEDLDDYVSERLSTDAAKLVLRKARRLGYEASFRNLVGRIEMIDNDVDLMAMVEALKATGGLVNAAKHRLLASVEPILL